MKVFLIIVVISSSANISTVPMDTMAYCEAAAKKIMYESAQLKPVVVTQAYCIVQGN